MQEPSEDQSEPQSSEEAPAPKRGGLGRVLRRTLVLFLVIGVLASGAAIGLVFWAQDIYQAPGPLQAQADVVIEPGSSLQNIASRLQSAGVIDHPKVFIGMLRYLDQHTHLKAGEYRFTPGLSQAEVADILISHQVVEHLITIPEGLTVAEIFQIIEQDGALAGPMPAKPAEGTLLPETYQYRRGDSRASLVERLQAQMALTVQTLWESRAENLPYKTPDEAVVLASIVEKETGVAAERAHIAGVFINRLEKGMRLQSDPTIVYALTQGTGPLGRALTRQDWKFDSPYNTYQNTGLPPGPIANPGRDALQAALQPMQTKDLYFVADGTGGHAFAETLNQHNRNVAKWRRIRDGIE